MNVVEILHSIPPLGVYALVGFIVGLESLGIPLPGETVLVAAAIMSAHDELSVSPLAVGLSGAAGAIIGDSIGYEIGHHFGFRLLGWLRRRFPRHVDPASLAYSMFVFHKYGPFAVFFGRFVALLRIFAGPISGALRLPYHIFLPANAVGGLTWALGTTFAVYSLGQAAEHALKGFAWVGLLLFLGVGVGASLVLRHRMRTRVHAYAAAHADEVADVDAKTRP